ncbi:hypothetical protein, partial [Promineifilum sp.]|uniref:hypothetical protein n=1 Tax=Promineifilum sp. TaxID=2664178 RepID=UPI0035ADA5FC
MDSARSHQSYSHSNKGKTIPASCPKNKVPAQPRNSHICLLANAAECPIMKRMDEWLFRDELELAAINVPRA